MIKANTSDLLRMKLIKFTLEQIGKKYVHGEHGPDSFDCAGFVWYVYNEVLGIDIYQEGFGNSTTTRIMTAPNGNMNYFLNDVKVGDILFFHTQSKNEYEPTEDNRYPGHCAIYLGDYELMHCTSMHKILKVTKSNLLGKTKLSRKLQRMYVGSKNIIDYL